MRAGSSSAQSTTSCSTSAWPTAYAKSGTGRSGASSVIGTGLFGHAP